MKTSLFCSNLGDALWVTPLVRHFPDLTVLMRKGDRRAEATAPIFDGIAKVELIDDPNETPKAWMQAHVTQRILVAQGLSGPSIPFIKLTQDEIDWAKKELATFVNPIVFINGNSANGKSNPRAEYVRPPVAALQELVNHYKTKGFTPLQFGPSPTFYDQDAFEPLEGCIPIRGLPIRKLAASYHVIGKMVSGDTGDYHLMLAAGGHATVLVPPHSDSFGYRYWDLLYDSTCWGDETPRVEYILHKDWERAKEAYQ